MNQPFIYLGDVTLIPSCRDCGRDDEITLDDVGPLENAEAEVERRLEARGWNIVLDPARRRTEPKRSD